MNLTSKPLLLLIALLIYASTYWAKIDSSFIKKTDPINSTKIQWEIQKRLSHNYFIENKGHWPKEVKYLAKLNGMNAWITDFGVFYDYYKFEQINNREKNRDNDRNDGDFKQINDHSATIKGHAVRLDFVNSGKNLTVLEKGTQTMYHNYILSKNDKTWSEHVQLYESITLKNIYDDIDIKYYFDQNSLRYDFIVNPGGNLNDLKLRLSGHDGLEINQQGELLINTSIGKVTNGELFTYQQENNSKKQIPCEFKQNRDGSIGFKTKSFNKNKPLIIDPLVYSTFIGGNSNDYATSIQLDNLGNYYLTGATQSGNYPVTAGAYDLSCGSLKDIFVTKFNLNSNSLLFSTFIGGEGDDVPSTMKLDNNGNCIISGYTNSVSYPTTSGAYDQIPNFGSTADVFVTKLNSSGTSLLYSTYIGGSGFDYANSLVLDNNNNCIVTGKTTSSDFPTTSGVYKQTKTGTDYDVFVLKLNGSGSNLVFSTYIGGTGDDYGNAITFDSNGDYVIAGMSSSTNYPTSPGAYNMTLNGAFDGFITKLNNNGSSLILSTLFGGINGEQVKSIVLDSNDNYYVSGTTYSSTYPTTPGAYDQSHNGFQDVFVSKINSSCSSLLYSTFIGGVNFDDCNAMTIDNLNNLYLTGFTNSGDYPTTNNAFNQTYNYADAFVTVLSPSFNSLLYSTFIGGSSNDYGSAVILDNNKDLYILGYSQSTDFPTTPGAYDVTHNSNSDVIFVKFGLLSTSLDLISEPNALNIYPNPASEKIIIENSRTNQSKVDIQIVSIDGKIVYHENFPDGLNSKKEINVSKLSKGVYIIKFLLNEEVVMRKICIN